MDLDYYENATHSSVPINLLILTAYNNALTQAVTTQKMKLCVISLVSVCAFE